MNQIFSHTVKATLPQLVTQYSQPEYQNHSVELWVFSDKNSRLKAQAELEKRGVKARVRSAFKPLLHVMLEERLAACPEPDSILIEYPVHQECSDNRFSLETYPLGALVGEATVSFVARQGSDLNYNVTLNLNSGQQLTQAVFAPNRVKQSITGQHHLSPTGWVRVRNSQGVLLKDESIVTDYEQVFDSILLALSEYEWKDDYFEELNIQVKGPFVDDVLEHEHEHISLGEALNEDLYFSLQEWFRYRVGEKLDTRAFCFGQVIPDTSYQAGDYNITISLDSFDLSDNKGNGQEDGQALAETLHPLTADQIAIELNRIEGEKIRASSVAGRTVQAVYHCGSDHPVMISGGQHANESTGVVGALRAAQELVHRPGSHFVISPQENPDGYNVFHRLMKQNPNHMHHAARYTALGNDLNFHDAKSPYESAIRSQAFAISQAQFHINLHGYPSHEWVRPFSGYIPHGFGNWTLPKGFFLILRYRNQSNYQALGQELLNRLTARLNMIPALRKLNARQMALFQLHSGVSDFTLINGIPCFVNSVENSQVALELITEYPDETIYGEDFVLGHCVQKMVVMAAYEIYQSLLSDVS
jgi:hypothetical protein